MRREARRMSQRSNLPYPYAEAFRRYGIRRTWDDVTKEAETTSPGNPSPET